MARELILVIDDNRTEAQVIGEGLIAAGFTVLYARDGIEGLNQIRIREPSLVIMDIQMPVMDGFKALVNIRNTPEISHILVILTTSLNRENLKIKSLELGADDYLPKPVKADELLARIKAVLRRVRSRSAESAIKGDLADLGLADLLQSMENATKTAIIRMEEIDAEIHVHEGALLYARQSRFKGYSALVRIFLQESGAFSVQFNPLAAGMAEKSEPLLPLLIRAAGEVDEIRDMLRQMDLLDKQVGIPAARLQDYPDIEKYREYFPCPALNIIILMDHDPQTNLETLARALQDRAVYLTAIDGQ